jgi:hypothetical protein
MIFFPKSYENIELNDDLRKGNPDEALNAEKNTVAVKLWNFQRSWKIETIKHLTLHL